MHKQVCFLVLAFAGFGSSQSVSADLVIDNYRQGTPLVQFGPGTAIRTTTGNGILGGEREESLTVKNLGGLGFVGIAGFGPNGVSVTQSATDQIDGSFSYSNFSPIDFTVNGYNRFRLEFNSSNSLVPSPGVISVTVTSSASSATVFADLPASTALPNASYVYFSEFGGFDFTNVDSVSFGFDFAGYPGRAFSMQRFTMTAIPEASSFAGAMLLAGGICLRRRRSSRNRVARFV